MAAEQTQFCRTADWVAEKARVLKLVIARCVALDPPRKTAEGLCYRSDDIAGSRGNYVIADKQNQAQEVAGGFIVYCARVCCSEGTEGRFVKDKHGDANHIDTILPVQPGSERP
jgi:hypothetical protein